MRQAGNFAAVPSIGVRRLLAVFALLAALAAGAPAGAGERLTVVELFTSQGCPLCPEVDEYIGDLTKRGDVLALSFHVDYWDYIGWADPFAKPAFTRRQEQYLARFNLPYVFTPQVVIDGVMHESGKQRDVIGHKIETASKVDSGRVDIELTRLSDDQVRIRIPDAGAVYRGEAEIVLVRFDERIETKVTKGENQGKTLVNYNVVRLVRPVADWNGEAVDLVVRLMELDEAGSDFCAALIQERVQGRILGAAVVDMRDPGRG